MLRARVPDVAAWIIGASVAVSVAAFGIYINSAPIVSIDYCGRFGCGTSVAVATEDFSVWGVVLKHNSALMVIYCILMVSALYGVVLVVERFLCFCKAGRQSREFQSKAGEALFRCQVARAISLARDYPYSPLAFVINAAFCNGADTGSRPSMSARHQAIVAQTIDLKRGLWHLSTIGWLLAMLALLSVCVGAINVSQMMRYAEVIETVYLIGAFSDSLSVVVYCVLSGFVILFAHRSFTAKAEHLQIEMERLSLSFIERVADITHPTADDYSRWQVSVYDNSRITSKLRVPRRSDDWNSTGKVFG